MGDGDAPDGADGEGDAPADDEDVTRSESIDADPVEPAVTDVDTADDGPDSSDEADVAVDADADAAGDAAADEADATDETAADEADATDGGYADPPDAVPDTGEPSVPDEGPTVDDDRALVDEDAVDDPFVEEDAGIGMGDGPASDEEQPIAVHVEEMVRRLGIVVLIAGIVSVLCFPFGDTLITVIWDGVLPASSTAQPHIYAPLELIVTQFKVASIAGVVVALPVIVYETYAFMRPGLYPHERRYYLAAIPTSLVLAVVGVVFAYFVVVPSVMSYFLYYSTGVANAALALGSTFNLILVLMAYLAIVFQIPLFVMLAIMMGLTSRRWLADRRLLFWGAFAGLSFIATPDPTGVAPVVVAATMIVLFEGTLFLLRWTERSPTPS
ncbi:twin-arginine translocation protein TatC [Halarchaeum acidiphilum MH1-52-1]|uniref:Sec-independent protein translocase protein TatC n=2 Tax=Halarchaeum acidiphilum TaxID=489138 RepID=U2YEF9_9EURY|nr:twin-arginine translocase subunit TatC [Halarchaeum acidiphilum]GAD52186.1 twin-arginine translocation protein TatC [Halarchaeum acidiphilum MH1-52-1]